MTFSLGALQTAVAAGRPITPDDMLALRRWVWANGTVEAAEADALFVLNDLVRAPDADWVDCFVEAIFEHVVNGREPKGYVDETSADWLIARIDRDGRIDSMAELELIVRLIERATGVPDRLRRYALQQVEAVVLNGAGPTRRGGPLSANRIDETEVALLRRLIFAPAGDGALGVSAEEADMLFRLKDATLGQDNAADWQRLFVQAVANHLMAHNSYRPLERAEAARLEGFMNDTHVNLGRFFGRMARSAAGGDVVRLFGRKGLGSKAALHDAAVAEAAQVTLNEAGWLKARIEADGELDPLERALLTFIAEEVGGPVAGFAELG